MSGHISQFNSHFSTNPNHVCTFPWSPATPRWKPELPITFYQSPTYRKQSETNGKSRRHLGGYTIGLEFRTPRPRSDEFFLETWSRSPQRLLSFFSQNRARSKAKPANTTKPSKHWLFNMTKFVSLVAAVLSFMPLTAWGRLLRAKYNQDSATLIVEACFTFAGKPLKGNYVKCYDEDYGLDDFIGSGTTDSDGCVTITNSDKWYEKPDVYCNVYRKSSDQKCFSGSTSDTKNNVAIPDNWAASVTLEPKDCNCLDGTLFSHWCW